LPAKVSGAIQLWQALFAIWKTLEGGQLDPKRGVTILKTEYAADYWQRRQKPIARESLAAAQILLEGRRNM
jgi:putative DNA methylase